MEREAMSAVPWETVTPPMFAWSTKRFALEPLQ